MIVTESVYQLINELCSSLHQADQFHPIKQSKLKTLKGRMHETILKTSPDSNLADAHELYLHGLECKLNGHDAVKFSALEECCRLVERDEYFRSEIGQSVMAFLLKLRNTGKCSDQNELTMPQYFFNSSAAVQRSPYFFLPPDMLRFSEDTRGVLRFRRGNSTCEKSFFGIPVENQSNKLLITSCTRSEDCYFTPSMHERPETSRLPAKAPIDSTIIRCGRWDNLGQPMDYLNARFSSEVDCTNQLLAFASRSKSEVKFVQLSQFIGDVKLLLTGIPSDSFHFDEKTLTFRMEENVSVENISPETMESSVLPFLECGCCYRRLQLLLSRNPVDFKHKFDGFVFKTLCTGVATFLMAFNQFVYMFDDTFMAQLLLRMSSMIQQIEILSHILRVHPRSNVPMEKALAVLPRGSEFLNYLYRKFVTVTQNDLAMLLFTILKECCTVYFKKFETWIFHGFIEDPYKELFIEFVDFYQPNTKHFWDKAYTIKQQSVPSFLMGCEDSALLCGKYTMLLKTIKPEHPFLTIPVPSIRVCFSQQQIGELRDICRQYVQDAQIVCGPAITVRQVYQQKSMKRLEFQQRCAVRFQENLQQWHKEQTQKRIKDKSNKEKHRKILEEQIEEIRERKIQKRIENLNRDREYLRQQEVLENERIAEENAHRQRTVEYYEELGRIVNDQQQRVADKIQKLSDELKAKPDDGEEAGIENTQSPVEELSDFGDTAVVKSPIDNANGNTTTELSVDTNLKKSASDYFNSNDIHSEFSTNKARVMGSTIEFNDTAVITGTETIGNQVLIDNRTISIHRDANSNELRPTQTERQRNKAKVLQTEFDMRPIVVKIDTAEKEVSNTEFQKNQQKSGAHSDIFRNEMVDELKKNRHRVLTEEFGYATDRNAGTNHRNKLTIPPVDWKPIRTSMSLDFSRSAVQNDLDAPTPMSIDTPTIHEEIEQVNDSPLKILIPRSEKQLQQSLDTLDGNEATPDSALNTCGILKKHGFVFETIVESVPVHQDCYKLSFSPSAVSKKHSFFALPNSKNDDETDENALNLGDIENVSTTTLGNFLKLSFAIPVHARLSILNNEILKIFLEDLDILSHLKSLRNFFLMMDGEFSSYISDGLITRLECTKSPTELFNFQFLHSILHNALNSSVYGNDQNADRLSFLIADVPQNFDLGSPNVLRTLNLSYRTDWPLNLVLTPEAMNHYASIFQHLLKLRRISWVLEQCFQILKEVGKTSESKTIYSSPQYRHVQQIRSKLLTFVNALQNHITSTALQGSWRAFKIDLESTRSIDDLYHKHAKYLKRVKFLCMLNRRSNEFFVKLEDVLIVILRFYYQLKQRSWRSDNTHPNFDKFLIIEQDFEKLVKFIIRIGSKISRCGYQTEIGDLINVINFNGFYDRGASQK